METNFKRCDIKNNDEDSEQDNWLIEHRDFHVP